MGEQRLAQRPTFRQSQETLGEKASILFSPDKLHNFMHDKVVVCDASVATGSFHFSKNATMNAENSLIFHDQQIADEFAGYIDKVVQAYKK